MTTRRDFLQTSSTMVTAAAAIPWVGRRTAHDLIVRGGTVLDGGGSPGTVMDVAITGGKIAALAPAIQDAGTEEIDARGLVVTPGFIDIHSHGDGTMVTDPRQESVLRQGITTIVVGQDGSSNVQVGEFLAGVDRLRPSVNVASMIGLGSVRGTVVGLGNRPATSAEVVRMTGMVEAALAQGACGASTGLEYTPGAFASTEELIAVCRPLAARRLPYSTHMRNEDDRVLEAIAESMNVARGAGCPLQIAHLKTQGPRNWGRLDDVFATVDRALRDGLDVAFDRYPYVAYQTGLTSLFPVWSRDGGTAAFLTRLEDPVSRDRIRTEVLAKVELIGGWDNVQIASVNAAEDQGAEGARLGRYAASRNAEPYPLTVAMMLRNGGNIGMVGFAMSEDNLDRILGHHRGMVCSDGGAFATEGPTRRGSPHPRGAGSFPRVIARYVRERTALTLEQAVHKMTAFPAARVGLRDRGRVAVGLAGDLAVFDADRIADTATYAQPFSYPTGIAAVVVNGVVSLRGGDRAVERGGRAVRPG